MAKRTAYEDLVLLPYILAEVITRVEYTGEEMSVKIRNSVQVAKIEQLRKEMSFDEEERFCSLCDERCKHAYEKKAKWFLKIVKMKDGRGQLQNFFRHWFASYLLGGKKSISPRGSTK